MDKPKVVALCGATASGKSSLAMALTNEFDCEIVCMDSMQIYRRMDIGTAKPTAEEQKRVPHHMLDILEPTESYAVADYALRAEKVILDIAKRGKLPLLVGGTGLYLKALMHGLELGGVKSDVQIRARLNSVAETQEGKIILHQKLEKVDPVSAAKFHYNDVRRVVRALEVYELTGKSIGQQTRQEPERPFEILPLAIDMQREKLYKRIELRIFQMLQNGLVDEVKSLLKEGVSPQAQSMQGIGYKELIPVAEDRCSLSEASRQMILNTRHYAKRQGTWMRAENRTVWLDGNEASPVEEALQVVRTFTAGKQERKED